jgi:hypothetical protein
MFCFPNSRYLQWRWAIIVNEALLRCNGVGPVINLFDGRSFGALGRVRSGEEEPPFYTSRLFENKIEKKTYFGSTFCWIQLGEMFGIRLRQKYFEWFWKDFSRSYDCFQQVALTQTSYKIGSIIFHRNLLQVKAT